MANVLGTLHNDAVVKDAILETAKWFNIDLRDINVTFPMPLDEGDIFPRIYWYAKMFNELVKPNPRIISGHVVCEKEASEEDIKKIIKYNMSFAILVSFLPQAGFIHSAIEAYQYDTANLLVACYLREVIEEMQEKTIEANVVKEIKLRTVGVAQARVIKRLQKVSIDWLLDIHKKMAADLKR